MVSDRGQLAFMIRGRIHRLHLGQYAPDVELSNNDQFTEVRYAAEVVDELQKNRRIAIIEDPLASGTVYYLYAH